MAKHLIIGDSHNQPGVSNARYEWLGRFIMDVRPDVIINMGDMADMKSLCKYDRGTKEFEGRAYLKDIDANLDALDRLYDPMNKYNKRRTRGKKKNYRPRQVITVGNHEHRIEKAVNLEPILEGTLKLEDLGFEQYYEVIPFLEPITIDGVTYCHYMQGKRTSQAISGVHIAYNLLAKYHSSITVGHCHQLDFKNDITAEGTWINGLSVGCYFEHDEKYAGQNNRSFWRGVILKDNVANGNYDWTAIRLETLRREYGERK